MTPREEEDLLVEATIGAYRDRDPDGLPVPPAAWFDLGPEARARAFEGQLRSRAIEAVLHERGWSTTVLAVLARL